MHVTSLIHLVQLPDESGKSSELRVGISLEALTSVFLYEDKNTNKGYEDKKISSKDRLA